MDELIERLLPSTMRERYGEEIRELLDHSRRPVRDRLDLVLAAVGMHLGGWLSALRLVAAVGACLSLVALLRSIATLGGGAVELLDHWWSTLALGCSALSLASFAALSIAQTRTRSWNRAR